MCIEIDARCIVPCISTVLLYLKLRSNFKLVVVTNLSIAMQIFFYFKLENVEHNIILK